jgi:hypothetical protein
VATAKKTNNDMDNRLFQLEGRIQKLEVYKHVLKIVVPILVAFFVFSGIMQLVNIPKLEKLRIPVNSSTDSEAIVHLS